MKTELKNKQLIALFNTLYRVRKILQFLSVTTPLFICFAIAAIFIEQVPTIAIWISGSVAFLLVGGRFVIDATLIIFSTDSIKAKLLADHLREGRLTIQPDTQNTDVTTEGK